MKILSSTLIVIAICAATIYQFVFVDAEYEAEERRQREDITEMLRLYGSTSKSANVIGTVTEIAGSVLADMEKLHPPIYRIPAHVLFVRGLRACRRSLGIAQAVGGSEAGDEAVAGCARALLR